MKSWYQLRMYWKHLFLTRHRGGHGVHSPLLFELITRVIEEKCAYYCYEDIEANLSTNDKSSLSMPVAQLLFRLLNFWQPAQCQTWFSAPDARLFVRKLRVGLWWWICLRIRPKLCLGFTINWHRLCKKLAQKIRLAC